MRLNPNNPGVVTHTCERCGLVRYFYRSVLRHQPTRHCQTCAVEFRRATRPSDAEMFWKFVDKRGPDECWLWRGALHTRGYGSFSGMMGKSAVLAHRYSWFLAHGAWPTTDKPHVLHTCDNPPCVNPAHLWIGTNADNHRDKAEKGRSARGETAGGVKLTTEQVRAIRARYAQGGISYKSLGPLYGVTGGSIRRVVLRLRWAHV